MGAVAVETYSLTIGVGRGGRSAPAGAA